jgi:hypothetical protein
LLESEYYVIVSLRERKKIRLLFKFLPKVSKEVTPRVTLAGIASGLIQNAIQDMTTMRAEGI